MTKRSMTLTGCAMPAVVLVGAIAAGTSVGSRAEPGGPEAADPWLVDVTAASGIDFTHANGAEGNKDYRETMGSGGCLLDYDGDGRLDV